MTARRQNPPTKFRLIFAIAVGCGVISVVPGSLAQSTKPVPFLAHRAIYDLSLDPDPSRPMVETARGRIVFEFSGSDCEGYTQNFRQVASLQGSDFGERLIDSRSLSYEDGDGRTMRFSGSLKINNAETQDTDGRIESKDNELLISLTKPEAETLVIGGSALFPTAHYQKLVATALSGRPTLEARVFDGTGDGKTVSDTFAVIGKLLPENKVSDVILKAGLAQAKRWPVTVSYFDGEGQDRETPSYSMSMELYENGVADALTLNYGEFVLKAALRQIEALPQKACP